MGTTLYAIGGSQFGPLTAVEAVGPDGVWQPAPSLPFPVVWGGAAPTADGFVIAGGSNKADGSTAVQVFDAAAGKWSAGLPLPQPVWAMGATASDGSVFLFGGFSGASSDPLTAVWRWRPGAAEWASEASLPTARAFPAAAAGADGKVYVLGGCAYGCATVLNRAEVYDPATAAWSTLPPMRTARAQLAAAAGADGRIYAFGGIDSDGVPLAAAEVFDPSRETWIGLPPMPSPRTNLAAVAAPDGTLAVIGGEDASFEASGEIDAYSPNAQRWTVSHCRVLDGGMPQPARFAALRQNLFEAEGCTQSGCHEAGAGPAVGNLDLATDPFHALLGQDGKGALAMNSQGQIQGLRRVSRGDPEHSLIWIKLSMTAVNYSTYGQPMPVGLPNSTPPELLGELRAWIQSGAPGP